MRIVMLGWFIVFTGSVGQYARAADTWFVAVDKPPRYLRNEKDTSKRYQVIRRGIDEARRYWGNYGPVYVYILGHEDETLNSDEFHRWIIEQYIWIR